MASWLDSCGVDEEGEEAERLVVFDPSGVASIDGGERRLMVLGHGHVGRLLGLLQGKKRRGEREGGLGSTFIHGETRHGDRGGCGGDEHVGGARSLQPWHATGGGRRQFCRKPPGTFSPFLFSLFN